MDTVSHQIGRSLLGLAAETMLWRAFGSLAKHRSKRPLDLPVHASTALRRAFGSLTQYQGKNPAQASAAFRRCSHIQQQVHQLHLVPARPETLPQEQHPLRNSSRGAPATCMLEPMDTVGESFDQKFSTLRSTVECMSDSELMLLLKKKTSPICYVWCDPSPWMHITQAIAMTINVNKMVKAGFKVKILMADWFARMEPAIFCKNGGDLSQVQTIGCYNIETWKATGMDLDSVEFVRLSDEISCNTDEYWPLAMDIARKSDISRIKSWLRVHASKDTRGHGVIDPYLMREFTAAEMFYPCLQCAAILLQKVDVWLLGLDQRGAYMLSRQYCNRMKREKRPIALFNNTLPNLLEYPEFESWDPRWRSSWKMMSGFICLLQSEVRTKIWDAYCPKKFIEGNPCLEYIKYIILPWFGKFEVIRKKESGGNKTFLSMKELTADYISGALHPADVKHALVNAINMILQLFYEFGEPKVHTWVS
ncbi:hypothetical protein ACQ4PT_059146 [Festuca glaucescens]